MDYAVVNIATSVIENVIVLEDGANWAPPEGTKIVQLVGNFGIGDTWDGSTFVKVIVPVIEDSSENTPSVVE